MIHSFDSATYIHTLYIYIYIYIYINIINPGGGSQNSCAHPFCPFQSPHLLVQLRLGNKPDLLMSPSWDHNSCGSAGGDVLGLESTFPPTQKGACSAALRAARSFSSPTARRFAFVKYHKLITTFSLLKHCGKIQKYICKEQQVYFQRPKVHFESTKVYVQSTKVYCSKYKSILSKYKIILSIYKSILLQKHTFKVRKSQSTKAYFQSILSTYKSALSNYKKILSTYKSILSKYKMILSKHKSILST